MLVKLAATIIYFPLLPLENGTLEQSITLMVEEA